MNKEPINNQNGQGLSENRPLRIDGAIIDPGAVAFDIDGVLADTMNLFLDIAKEDHDIGSLRYEDITSYRLVDCLKLEPGLIEAIVGKILDGGYRAALKPIDGSAEVLTRIAREGFGPILLVTARPYAGPIHQWICSVLDLNPNEFEMVTTGNHETKAQVLLERGKTHFVDDRLETCFMLDSAGVTPVLFRQPWNRQPHPFLEVGTWVELSAMMGLT